MIMYINLSVNTTLFEWTSDTYIKSILSFWPVSQQLQIIIFNDNVRIFCLSWIVKKWKTNTKLDRQELNHFFHNVLCHVLATELNLLWVFSFIFWVIIIAMVPTLCQVRAIYIYIYCRLLFRSLYMNERYMLFVY